MANKDIGTFRGVKVIDLTGFDGNFFITPVSEAVGVVDIVAVGKASQVAVVRAFQKSSSRTVVVTDRSHAAGSVGGSKGVSIPPPRRRGANLVVRRSDSGEQIRRPIEKVLKSAPISRTGEPGVTVRIGALKGTVVKY